ncbi:MAG: hypothetical protein HWQ58_13815 [Nostoc sp. LPT]|uniref:hypothetical protein n=1 Tax=uncultured Nostoc sp. TaxID=340711 RepID=UPI001D876F48|nr:hypothetical protein [Nostoc sp. LPT]
MDLSHAENCRLGRTLVLPNKLFGNIGFRSSNATCFSQGETLREQVGRAAQRSGSPTYVD